MQPPTDAPLDPSATTPLQVGKLAALLAARRSVRSRGFVALDHGVRRMSYADSWSRATHTAVALNEAGLDNGSPVLVTTDDPLALVAGFFGALLAGHRPVPVPDPGLGHPRNFTRVRTVLSACAPGAVLAPSHRVSGVAGALVDVAPSVPIVAVSEPTDTPAEIGRSAVPDEYWQFTSGTSRAARRITLSGDQVVAHLEQAACTYEESAESISVNWVPLHHDMGLVTSVLRPLHSGYESVLLPAARFVAAPETWLRALTEYGGTHTSSPDFGYALCTRKVRRLTGVHLGRLRVARVAGELVRASTLDGFTRAFAPVGFRRIAFAPSFGMAEAVLTVTTCGVDEEPRVVSVDRRALARDEVRDEVAGEAAVQVVSCGHPLPGTVVTVVTPDARPAAPGTIGEIHIAGPQVVLDEAHVAVDGVAGRLTGDFGFVRDGELYLLGRSQERFQVNGENFYTADVEAIAQDAAPDLRRGRVRVMLMPADGDRQAGVAVLGELRNDPSARSSSAMTTTARAVVSAVARHLGLTVHTLHLLQQGALPLTSSGKLRRDALYAGAPAGTIHTHHRVNERLRPDS